MDEYEERLEHGKLLARISDSINEMEKTEGFAYTEDGYSARIPGKTLRNWREALQKAYFKLNKD